jgi:CheY-like chemotaxis protein
VSEQVPQELVELFAELRPELLRQVAELRELVAACADGALDAAGQEQARSLAHQLAGSLGSFGFAAAGAAARALELRFKQGVAPGSGPRLLALAADLEARVDSGPPAQPAPAREPAIPAVTMDVVDVALVEDDELLGELATTALRSRGYAVRWIADGDEAVRLLAGDEPPLRAQLVLLDWELPSRSGIDVLKALPDDLPVVMVTGHGDPQEVAQARALGARAHVAKPWTVKGLAATVREQLGR